MKASEIEPILKTQPGRDKQTAARKSQTRRPRLTLRHLHRLRLMHERKKLEAAQKEKFVKDMYGSKEETPKKQSRESTKYLRKHTGT